MKKLCRKNLSGGGLVTLLIILAIVAVVALLIWGFGGGGFGGGKGDGEGEAVSVNATVENPVTEEVTIQTEQAEYINVTVAGNDYLYLNEKIELSELLDKLKAAEPTEPVYIKDADASKKAYNALTEALRENKIRYIEGNE